MGGPFCCEHLEQQFPKFPQVKHKRTTEEPQGPTQPLSFLQQWPNQELGRHRRMGHTNSNTYPEPDSQISCPPCLALNQRHQTLPTLPMPHDFIAFITTFLKSLCLMLKGLSPTAHFFYRAHPKISKSLAVFSLPHPVSVYLGLDWKQRSHNCIQYSGGRSSVHWYQHIKQLMPPQVVLPYCPNSSNI